MYGSRSGTSGPKNAKAVAVWRSKNWSEQSCNRRDWLTWESLNPELGGSFFRKEKKERPGD